MSARILVAGIGNIFLGDDAFGVEVAQRLERHSQPPGVSVVDYGIRGFDLAFALCDDYDAAILVDATQRGEAPGTLYVLEIDADTELGGPAVETHNINPHVVLSLVKMLGGQPHDLYLVGCEPGQLGLEEDGHLGLSAPVEAAIDEAVRMVEALIGNLLAAGRQIVQPAESEART